MLLLLRALFTAVIVSMLWVTSWASLNCPLFAVPADVFRHPWFIATMFDAYWGFTTFFVWVFYQQTSWLSRCAWFIAIMLLGNIAMASYCLAALLRAPADGQFATLLARRHQGPGVLGPSLAAVGIVVIAFAWKGR